MNPHQIRDQIADRLSLSALNFWVGCSTAVVNEIVIHAQRHGVEDAIAEVEQLARPHRQIGIRQIELPTGERLELVAGLPFPLT